MGPKLFVFYYDKKGNELIEEKKTYKVFMAQKKPAKDAGRDLDHRDSLCRRGRIPVLAARAVFSAQSGPLDHRHFGAGWHGPLAAGRGEIRAGGPKPRGLWAGLPAAGIVSGRGALSG